MYKTERATFNPNQLVYYKIQTKTWHQGVPVKWYDLLVPARVALAEIENLLWVLTGGVVAINWECLGIATISRSETMSTFDKKTDFKAPKSNTDDLVFFLWSQTKAQRRSSVLAAWGQQETTVRLISSHERHVTTQCPHSLRQPPDQSRTATNRVEQVQSGYSLQDTSKP